MNINKSNLFFNPNSTNKTYFCRSCNNSFYSKVKYDDHILYCQTSKPMILMLSKTNVFHLKIFKIQFNYLLLLIVTLKVN